MMRRSSTLCAVSIALAMLVGCGSDDPPAVVAAKKFAAAVQSGDTERVLALAESAAAERVGQLAERASDQVGGRRLIEPREMLQVVDVDPSFQVADAAIVGGDGVGSAVVALTGADGTVHELTLVDEEGEWRVRIPVPMQPAEVP